MNKYDTGDILKVSEDYIVNPLTGDIYNKGTEFQIIDYVVSKDWQNIINIDYALSFINKVPFIELEITEHNLQECFEYVRWEYPVACEEWVELQQRRKNNDF